MANRKQSFVSQEHLVNSLYQEAKPVASTVSVAGLGFAGRLSGPQVDQDLTGRKALPSPLSFSLFGPPSGRLGSGRLANLPPIVGQDSDLVMAQSIKVYKMTRLESCPT